MTNLRYSLRMAATIAVLTTTFPAWSQDAVPCDEVIDADADADNSCIFVRGDINGDSFVDAADLPAFLDYYFVTGELQADCLAPFDANDDGTRSFADFWYISRYLFLGGSTIPAPFPRAGRDPTPCSGPVNRERFIAFHGGVVPAITGRVVTVPVYLNYRQIGGVPKLVKSYTIGFRYDPSYMELVGMNVAGTELEPFVSDEGGGQVSVSTKFGRGEGRMVVTTRFNARNVGLKPADNILIGNLNFRVNDSVPEPYRTEVQFIDTAFSTEPTDQSLPNEIVLEDEARLIRPQLIPAEIRIEGGEIIRGDANSNGQVDLQDFLQMVEMFFVTWGDRLPSQIAALDINDDGMISLMDPLCQILFLFQGGREPAQPFPGPGRAQLRPVPAPTPGYSFTIDSFEMLPEKYEVPVLMTNPGPAWGFTLSLHFDPAVIEVGEVRLASDLPAIAPGMENLITSNIDRESGRIVMTAIFNEPIRSRNREPIVFIDAKPRRFPEHYTHFCFQDRPRPQFQWNEIITDLEQCRTVRPVLNSARVAAAHPFQRGDANRDGTVDVSDGITVLNFLFSGTSELNCKEAADADDNGRLELTDGVYIFDFLFLGGRPIPAPGPFECGGDPTIGDIFPFCAPPERSNVCRGSSAGV